MDNPVAITLSRLMVADRALSVIANNIANVATPGFQAERMGFADYLVSQNGTSEPPGGREMYFTQDRATYRDQTRGTFVHTGNPLDLAIGTTGYFAVQTDNGIKLTRAGRFTLNASGDITDEAGNALLDTNNQKLSVSGGGDITIAGDGSISLSLGGTTSNIGKIGVFDPQNPYAMRAEGNRLFDPGGPTSAVASPGILQGAVEDSNVQPIVEITRLIAVQRDFESLTKFVEAEGQRRQDAISRITDIGIQG
jgi:flagellar basal-body rod protein FlgF